MTLGGILRSSQSSGEDSLLFSFNLLPQQEREKYREVKTRHFPWFKSMQTISKKISITFLSSIHLHSVNSWLVYFQFRVIQHSSRTSMALDLCHIKGCWETEEKGRRTQWTRQTSSLNDKCEYDTFLTIYRIKHTVQLGYSRPYEWKATTFLTIKCREVLQRFLWPDSLNSLTRVQT